MHVALWCARTGAADDEHLLAALALLPAARAELDQVETATMFCARSLGMTWGELARAMGLRSPQAAQQRLDRLASRYGKDRVLDRKISRGLVQ